MKTKIVTVPEVQLRLEDLLAAIRRLDQESLRLVARTLIETERLGSLDDLIRRLANRPPADDISDEMIDFEVRAVREARAQGYHVENRG